MQIDFRLPREWAQANQSVAQYITGDIEPRLFQNMSAAVVETVFGLSQLYPLKKKVFFIKNANPLFDAAVMPLAKMGYLVTGLELSVLDDPTAFAGIVDRECLLILYSLDDPILGRAYPVEKLEAALKEKVIVQVRLSHNAHFFSSDGALADGDLINSIPRLAAHIYTLQPEGALALCGVRARFGVLVADQLAPPSERNFSWLKTPRQNAKQKILDFEKRKVAGAQPVFETALLRDGGRVYDRAVVTWPDLDGHAVITRLAGRLNITLAEPGRENRLECTSLSRWGGVRTMDFLKTQGLSPEAIRGLVMIDADLLNAEFEKHLLAVRDSLLADQFGGATWSTPTA